MHDLEAKDSRIALICDDGRRIGYRELAGLADDFASDLRSRTGRDRGLLVIEMRNTPEAVIAYLGALRANWPAILVAEGSTAANPDLIDTFKPDLVYLSSGSDWRFESPATTPDPHDLHPDLAVMLSTSGSTGSTKLVRLSRANIHENAASIAEYLEIDADRTAITSLPMHYSYGLSVLNSFLLAGGAVVLTEASVVEDEFRGLLDREKVTDLAGVPYTYEILERLNFRANPAVSLRVMTQAGGRLPPDLVRAYAEFAKGRGLRFFVMYGQTEATARMAYLPPDQALHHSDCIGIAIPRGRFSLRAETGAEITEADRPGELIYNGPNVMMGYALQIADLAAPPMLDELATGDIAIRKPDGLYRIIGRSSRFIKVAGLRIGLDDVEAILRKQGFAGSVTGEDGLLIVALSAGDPQAAQQRLSAICGLPLASIFVWSPPEIPTLSSGKIDYQTIRRTGLALAETAQALQAADASRSVARVYARALGVLDPKPDQSFVGLGGDSLAYVTVSIGLESILGKVPRGWEGMPIQNLQTLADGQPALLQTQPNLTLGSDVLLRLLAISLIFIGHGAPDHTEAIRGGSGMLFCLAGYSMAILQSSQLLETRIAPILKGLTLRLILPYFLMMTALLFASDAQKSASWYYLGSVFELTAQQRGPLFSFWFIETLIHAIVLTCGLFLVPSFRRQMQTRPFPTLLVLIALSTLLRLVGAQTWPNGNEINLTMDGWLYAFFIGWAVHFARTAWQKGIIVVLALGLALEQFGFSTGRAYWFAFAVAVLLTMPFITVNRKMGLVLAYVAGTTYFMYLGHPLVTHIVKFKLDADLGPLLSIGLVYGGSVVFGILYSEGWHRAVRGLQGLFNIRLGSKPKSS